MPEDLATRGTGEEGGPLSSSAPPCSPSPPASRPTPAPPPLLPSGPTQLPLCPLSPMSISEVWANKNEVQEQKLPIKTRQASPGGSTEASPKRRRITPIASDDPLEVSLKSNNLIVTPKGETDGTEVTIFRHLKGNNTPMTLACKFYKLRDEVKAFCKWVGCDPTNSSAKQLIALNVWHASISKAEIALKMTIQPGKPISTSTNIRRDFYVDKECKQPISQYIESNVNSKDDKLAKLFSRKKTRESSARRSHLSLPQVDYASACIGCPSPPPPTTPTHPPGTPFTHHVRRT